MSHAKYFLFICCFSGILSAHMHCTQSIFSAGPPRTIPNKICYNIGSKVESVGPYQAETSSLVFLRSTPRISTIKSNILGTPYHRAFAVQRTSYREMSFYVRGEPNKKYRYSVELGFIDSKNCWKKGTDMKAVVGHNKVSLGNINAFKAKGCNRPYLVGLHGATPDAWNRIVATISGPAKVSLSTVCFKKDSSKLTTYTGDLYLSADDASDLYLNGKLRMQTRACGEIKKIQVDLKRDDIIAVSVTNGGQFGGLQVAFILNGHNKIFFGTNTEDWKVRLKFRPEKGLLAWTSQSYVDNDWPSPVISYGCKLPEFPDVTLIWTDTDDDKNTLFFRYRFRD